MTTLLRAPYVEARNQYGKQKPTAIILHPTYTNSQPGSALAVAQVWHKSTSFWEAAHYVVDSKTRFRCVRDNVIAGKENVDKGAIRIAVCAEPASLTTFWNEGDHDPVLKNTAELVAALTLTYNINARYLGDEDKAKWEKRGSRRRGGIYVAEQSGWPFLKFMNEVDAQRDLMSNL